MSIQSMLQANPLYDLLGGGADLAAVTALILCTAMAAGFRRERRVQAWTYAAGMLLAAIISLDLSIRSNFYIDLVAADYATALAFLMAGAIVFDKTCSPRRQALVCTWYLLLASLAGTLANSLTIEYHWSGRQIAWHFWQTLDGYLWGLDFLLIIAMISVALCNVYLDHRDVSRFIKFNENLGQQNP